MANHDSLFRALLWRGAQAKVRLWEMQTVALSVPASGAVFNVWNIKTCTIVLYRGLWRAASCRALMLIVGAADEDPRKLLLEEQTMLYATWQQTWQRLRLIGVIGAAGATVILRLSAARLVGIQEDRLQAGIGEHG
jgi:hypothetical protein